MSPLSDEPTFHLDNILKSVRNTYNMTDNRHREHTEHWVLEWQQQEEEVGKERKLEKNIATDKINLYQDSFPFTVFFFQLSTDMTCLHCSYKKCTHAHTVPSLFLKSRCKRKFWTEMRITEIRRVKYSATSTLRFSHRWGKVQPGSFPLAR